MHMTSRLLPLLMIASLMLAACSSPKPRSHVSEKEMKDIRSAYASLATGVDKAAALAKFKAGNQVKLSSAEIAGVSIEEWKVEALREAKPRNDLFISHLYFANGRLVDISDSRVNFRENTALVERWGQTGE
jgi:soluble cytochrome b562